MKVRRRIIYKNTSTALYGKFNPVIKNSFTKVGADKVGPILLQIQQYSPYVNKVNPDLTDYVTNQALNSVFKMVAVEEKNIRTNLSARTSVLLQRSFCHAGYKID
jgi:hypothetical protein